MAALATEREILAAALRDVYLDSSADRSFHRLALAKTIEIKTDSADVRSLVRVRDLPIADIAYVRPERELPTDLVAFQQQSQLDRTFAIGEHDAAHGFTPDVWESFRL